MLPPVEITPAILIRKTKLTETSLIISWLTRDLGRVKTVAKGARSARSPFAGTLDLFFSSEIHFARSRRGELHQLREAALSESFEALRYDYDRTALSAYFVELLELVTEPEHPVPELYDLLLRALRHLDEQPASTRALLHFEAELARLLGIQAPGLTPALAIGRVWHKLPHARKGLLDRLA